jgi:glycosyltransferase involved in cell wall biosynthesis
VRLFWFTNILMPDVCEALNRPPEVIGGWMFSLLDELKKNGEISLAVTTICQDITHFEKMPIQGVTYYLIPQSTNKDDELGSGFRQGCDEAIRDYSPDLIHVHGTEDVYGLYTARSHVPCPVVISIQGLLSVYYRHVLGGMSLVDYCDAGLAGCLAWMRFALQHRNWRIRGEREVRVIEGNNNFIGRTLWDKAHVGKINSSASYYHCEELLRPVFSETRWDISTIDRRTIFCTAAHSPLKGFHWLLYALLILRKEFPDIQVRVAGAPWNAKKGFGYYGRYIKKLIDKYDLATNIVPLPMMTADQIARQLKISHLFVIPSLIENSPNSLAEAMMVGTPSVVSLIGGIPSMITDRSNALGFPSGDATCLASCIRQIFQDDDLANHISVKAIETARKRNGVENVVPRQIEIYERIIGENRVDQ